MPRPVWSGTISFGLVNIPVRLFSSVRNNAMRFQQLRKQDGCRIRVQKICPVDGAEVPPDQIVKGYEFSPDRYVVISQEELDELYPEKRRTIEIEDFVSLGQVNPIYYESTYYVAPDPGAAKSFSLLAAAMLRSQKVGVARIVIRNKEYLAILRPLSTALALSTVYYQDEIVGLEQFEAQLAEEIPKPDAQELQIAVALIEQMTTAFSPKRYKDIYLQAVQSLLDAKAAKDTVETPQATAVAAPTKVIDLMAALEASLKTTKRAKPAARPTTKRKGRSQAK